LTAATDLLPPAPAFGTPVEQAPCPEVLQFLARRRSTPALTLQAPGPRPDEIAAMLQVAARVPDHGKLAPWRFVLLPGEEKAAFAARLEALALSRGETKAAAKLAKLKVPPFGVAVIARPRPHDIPEWEQILSAGAAATALLFAAQAMGYGANWITDWYAYDAEARAILGLAPEEQVAAFMLLGTAAEAPLERERPDSTGLVSTWRP
jgi:nitroreductase